MLWFVSPRPDARAQAARSDTLPVGGIVRLSVGRHRGRLGVRCVRMGSRAADESAATEGARRGDGGRPAAGPDERPYQPRAMRRAPTLARHHAPPTDGHRRTASGARCVGAQAARSVARSACHDNLHQYHRTPQPARVTVSVRWSRPPTGHRRAAGGDATTTAPPLPDRRATRGVSSRCDPQQLMLAEISTKLRRGRPETTTVHICIL